MITPNHELNSNSLYTFVLTVPNNDPVSSTFQTRRDFSILGVLPADQSSYVPVNSGIEIYFSHTGFEDLDKYFAISPQVEGRFERNGYAAVFIPKELNRVHPHHNNPKRPCAERDGSGAIGNYAFSFRNSTRTGPGTQ